MGPSGSGESTLENVELPLIYRGTPAGKRRVSAPIAKLGTNLLLVRPGQGHRNPGGTRSTADMFDVFDAEAIAREISGLVAVAP